MGLSVCAYERDWGLMDTKSSSVEVRGGSPATEEQSGRGLLYVTIAVIFFGTSPIFIRWADPFSAVEVAFWRLAIAALVMAAVVRSTGQRFALTTRCTSLALLYTVA